MSHDDDGWRQTAAVIAPVAESARQRPGTARVGAPLSDLTATAAATCDVSFIVFHPIRTHLEGENCYPAKLLFSYDSELRPCALVTQCNDGRQ